MKQFYMLLLGLLLCTLQSRAQYTLTTIESSAQYTALAKDNSNNIYGVRINAATNKGEVVKYTNGNPSPTVIYGNLSVVIAGQAYPWGIAVNAAGDVFVNSINDATGWEIIKLSAPSYTAQVIQTGRYFSTLAVDRSNNLLAMEFNGTAYQLVRYAAGAENMPGTVVWGTLPLPGVLSPAYPCGIVVDSHDNIYLLDFPANNGGQLWKLTAPAFTATLLGSNKAYCALAIDAADNIYTTEIDNGSTFRVMKYADPAGAGAQLFTGLNSAAGVFPWGLVVTSAGTIYAGDFPAAPNGRLITLSPPGVTVSSVNRVSASPTNANSVQYTVTFSGSAANVTAGSFGLTTTGITGAGITSVSGSGSTYTVTVNTGTGDGTIRLDVNGTGISPAIVNVPFTGGQQYLIDKTAPTGSIAINAGAAATNNTNVVLTITGNDANPLQMAFNNDGAAYSANENLAATKNWTLTAADGAKTVNMRLRDQAGNESTFSDQITLDQTVPNTTIITTPPLIATSSTATFTFNASEAGTFEASIDGSGYMTVASPLSYLALAQGSHTFSVRAKDAAGNVDASPATYTWTIDATAPAITSVNVPANGYYKAGDVLSFTVNFSENITISTAGGNPSLDLAIGLNTLQATYTGSGANALMFSYTVQAGDNDMDGIELNSLALNGATITDAAGHNANITLNNVALTNGVFVNTVIPSVTLSSTGPGGLSNTPFTVEFTFSENVTGFTSADINVTNAAVSPLTVIDNAHYSATIVPVADGPVTVTVPANVVTNVGNNGNSASNTLSIVYDATAPVVTSVTVPATGYYNTGNNLDFTVNYSENVTVNTTAGTPTIAIDMGGTVVYANYVSGSGNTALYRYTVVAGDMDMNGIIVANLQLNGGTIRDAAGNNANLILFNTDNTSGVRVNTAIPAVTISGTPALNGPWTATVTFSEDVTGFTITDISSTNAAITNLQIVNAATYSVTVTPIAEGTVTIQVPAGVAKNAGGNDNTASAPFTYLYDNTAPVITGVTVPADGFYKAGNLLNFTVSFSEDIVAAGGTQRLEIALTSGTVQAALIGTAANSLTFQYTVQPGDMDANGIEVNALQLNGGTIRDAANNNANLTLNNVPNTGNVIVNTGIPSVIISTPNALQNTPWTATITFSEAVTVFTESDINVTNATLSNLQSLGNITYTVLVTPVADGNVTMQVPANSVVNNAGTANTASNSVSYTYDGTAPAVNAVFVPINGYYKTGDVLNFVVFFNENINLNSTGGTPILPVTIGTTPVQATYTVATANSLSFSYTVQAGQKDLDGITVGTSLQLNGATLKDDATNDANPTLQNIANTTQVFVHTGYPTVTLSTTAATRVNTPFTVTAVFDEAVTGLNATDFGITNGTAGALISGDNITYILEIIPTADGPVSIQLPANAAINVVSNGNQASNTISINYDATAPLITAIQSFLILQNSTAGTQVGKVLATEAVGTLQNWTITSDGSGGAFAIDASGNITVQNGTALNNNVGNTVTVMVTVSDGLNTSTATPVDITVTPINKAPLLDAINNVSICATTDAHTIQVTGASAVEPTQIYTLSISSNQAYFDALTINNAGLINYSLKNNVTSGAATITVTIKDNGGTANGGVDTYQRSFTITVNPLPVVTITSDKGNSVSKGDIAHLTASGGATYNWEASSSIISGQQSAVAEVRPQANTTYRVTATSADGCSHSATFSMSVIEDFKVDATNVLTPNGDGKNDRWVIRNIDSYPDNELKIFDRAGRLVYSQRNYNNTWDGRVNGNPLAEGTYYYYLSISGGAKTAKGYITIILKAN